MVTGIEVLYLLISFIGLSFFVLGVVLTTKFSKDLEENTFKELVKIYGKKSKERFFVFLRNMKLKNIKINLFVFYGYICRKEVKVEEEKDEKFSLLSYLWNKTGNEIVNAFRESIITDDSKGYWGNLKMKIQKQNYNISRSDLILRIFLGFLNISFLYAILFTIKEIQTPILDFTTINGIFNMDSEFFLFDISLVLFVFYLLLGLIIKPYGITGIFKNIGIIIIYYFKLVGLLGVVFEKLGITSFLNKVEFILTVSFCILVLLIMEKIVDFQNHTYK